MQSMKRLPTLLGNAHSAAYRLRIVFILTGVDFPRAAAQFAARLTLAALLPLMLGSAAPASLLSVTDPAGDAQGDGSYQLPARPTMNASQFDLRALQVQDIGGKLQLAVTLGSVGNPWNAPAGFSGVVLDVFIKTGPGGASALTGLGLRVPSDSGWQEHYRVNGFVRQHFRVDGAGKAVLQKDAPSVKLDGTELILTTNLEAGSYRYWVTSSLYTPLGKDGFWRPGGDSGTNDLRSARAGSPAPLDVLLAGDQRPIYTSGVLPGVGQVIDVRALTLLGIAAAGLLIAIIAGVIAWRRHS